MKIGRSGVASDLHLLSVMLGMVCVGFFAIIVIASFFYVQTSKRTNYHNIYGLW
ncbi:Conserved hypothetical membrane protein [Zobellia galactanivorans]|uniref:Conserved hypothetical membrane protein n=1 Tax=Zobellia galactanivorans (strain DSM 12802 / CCUG 47099 / CIP 106680 / NCIMB 13871 / Dsij) TaxID=63186 RepID=G0L9J5_ZOBGA|nr:Conserved hypothetical membrane protein [Zobellia galactanivorans]